MRLLAANVIRTMVNDAVESEATAQDIQHAALMQSVMHAQAHGDIELMLAFYKGFEGSVKQPAILEWLMEYFPINDKCQLIKVKKVDGKLVKGYWTTVVWRFKDAEVRPFYMVREEQRDNEDKPPKALDDLLKQLKSLASDKRLESGKVGEAYHLAATKAYEAVLAFQANPPVMEDAGVVITNDGEQHATDGVHVH